MGRRSRHSCRRLWRAVIERLWQLDAADLDSCRGWRHCCRQTGLAVAVPTAAARHSDDTTTVAVGSRLLSREDEATTFPTAVAAFAIAVAAALCAASLAATLLHLIGTVHPWTSVECVGIAAAAGGSDALPLGRSLREALTRLQLAEAPSLAMWRLSHQQVVCSTVGQTESSHFTSPNSHNRMSLIHKRIIFRIDEANVLNWRECERGVN